MEANLKPGSIELVDGDPLKHAIPGVGKLGESIEDHERARVGGLAAAGPQPPVPVRERAELPAVAELRAAKTVVREMLQDLRGELTGMVSDIRANNDLLRHIDVPLEQVADSHERATHSFETLRADISRLDDRLALLEAVCRSILAAVKGTGPGSAAYGHDEHGPAFPGE